MDVLPTQQSKNLKAALLVAYPRMAALRTFADDALDLNIETIDGDNLQDKIHGLIVWAKARGRLIALLDAAVDDRPRNDILVAAVESARRAMATSVPIGWYSPPADPFETCFLKGGRAFIDRKQLRVSLRTLHRGDASSLVVTGAPQTGKSYSLRFVTHIADSFEYRVARLNLREMGTEFGPGELAEGIVQEMGRSASVAQMPMQQSQVPRWTEELRRFVTGEITASGEKWWIVLDGVDPKVVRDDTLSFIGKLVLVADEYLYEMRVVLLDCDAPMPPEVDPYVEKEEVQAIEDGLLREFFEELGRHRQAEFTQVAIDAAVKDVWRLAPEGPNRLRRLAKAVETVARSLPG